MFKLSEGDDGNYKKGIALLREKSGVTEGRYREDIDVGRIEYADGLRRLDLVIWRMK